MIAVILGKESIEQLEVWTKEKLSSIPNNMITRTIYTDMIYSEEELGKIGIYKTSGKERRLDIIF